MFHVDHGLHVVVHGLHVAVHASSFFVFIFSFFNVSGVHASCFLCFMCYVLIHPIVSCLGVRTPLKSLMFLQMCDTALTLVKNSKNEHW